MTNFFLKKAFHGGTNLFGHSKDIHLKIKLFLFKINQPIELSNDLSLRLMFKKFHRSSQVQFPSC